MPPAAVGLKMIGAITVFVVRKEKQSVQGGEVVSVCRMDILRLAVGRAVLPAHQQKERQCVRVTKEIVFVHRMNIVRIVAMIAVLPVQAVKQPIVPNMEMILMLVSACQKIFQKTVGIVAIMVVSSVQMVKKHTVLKKEGKEILVFV